MRSNLNRRDFLKLATLLSLSSVKWPAFMKELNEDAPNQDTSNVLILVFDAFSAENASLLGYKRETTPNLVRFAERATIYHANYAGGNFTTSGTSTLLTGTYPWTHRAFNMFGTIADNLKQRNIFNLFDEKDYFKVAYSHNPLANFLLYQFRDDLDVFPDIRELCITDDQFADIIFPNDYNAAFWSEWFALRGNENPPSSLFLSMFQRMLRFTHKRSILEEYGSGYPRGIPNLFNTFYVLEDAINWIMGELETLPQPYLAYFHLLPPHDPYMPHKDFVGLFGDGWSPKAKPTHFASQGHSTKDLNRKRREYDEFIAYTDAEFGRLYDFMHRTSVFENTYVILTSDHGEMFERGIWGHSTPTLYQPILRVPLIISKPHQERREDIFTPTSTVDLLPTLLHTTGQKIPDWCEGEILPAFGEEENADGRIVYAVEAKSNSKFAPLTKGTVAMMTDEYKLIHYLNSEKTGVEFELYDLKNDPEERTDLSTTKNETADDLKSILLKKLQEVNQT